MGMGQPSCVRSLRVFGAPHDARHTCRRERAKSAAAGQVRAVAGPNDCAGWSCRSRAGIIADPWPPDRA
jgi:hypothetical protein